MERSGCNECGTFRSNQTTGRFVLEEALARGHKVAALVRPPGRLDTDHESLETVVGDVMDPEAAASGLDWTITRPVSLRDVEPTGRYLAGPTAAMNGITLKVGLTDLARFTLDQLDGDRYLNRRPGISY